MIQNVPTSIRKHPTMSREVAAKIDGMEPRILDIVSQHHEYIDGSGYPLGVKRDDIDELSRIVCIAEVYCHMVSPIQQEHAINPHDAVGVILDPRFNRFDPRVLRAFIANMAIYPAGTFIQLNNYVRGVVLSSNVDKPMRPKVLVLYDDDNKPVKPFPVDLSDPKYSDWYIDKVIPGQDITKTLGKLLRI
jgi:HD-GYP domain-containing protein (c-di-GMP phosphodiesterase class II)